MDNKKNSGAQKNVLSNYIASVSVVGRLDSLPSHVNDVGSIPTSGPQFYRVSPSFSGNSVHN